MDGFIEEPLPPTLGCFSMARVLFDVRNHASIEDDLPIVLGVEPSIEVEIRTFQNQTSHFGHSLQRVQTIWKQTHSCFMHWSDWEWRQHIAIVGSYGQYFLAFLVFVPRVTDPITPFLATVFVPSPWSTRT